MIKPLYKHQQKFVKNNPRQAILSWEAGTGKTRAAVEWLNNQKEKSALIICPKGLKAKWQEDLKKWGFTKSAKVISKEEVKKLDISIIPSDVALVVDEFHYLSSPLFIAKDRSAMTETLYNIIKRNPDMPRLFLTANVVRSSPANLHTALYLSVQQIDWKKWQSHFYELVKKPYIPRPTWSPKNGWQKEMIPIIAKYCDVVLMKDCVDVPVHEEVVQNIKLKKETMEKIKNLKNEEWEAIKLWYEENRLENGKEKLEWIKDYIDGRKKIVIVCKYKEQIATYAKELEKIKQTFMLTGDTKDQAHVVRDAQECSECVLLIQSAVCTGYDLDTFSHMVFASFDFSWVNFSQMKARINRIHNLHTNQYIYLIGGKKDKSVLDSMELKKDFDISSIK